MENNNITDRAAYLKKVYNELTQLREEIRKRPDFDSLIEIDGDHIYGKGLYKTLSPNFVSSGSSDKLNNSPVLVSK